MLAIACYSPIGLVGLVGHPALKIPRIVPLRERRANPPQFERPAAAGASVEKISRLEHAPPHPRGQ